MNFMARPSNSVWVTGARIRTLPAAIAPVLLATALAGSDFHLLPALLALIVSLSLQVGVNYANDYSDGVRGSDDNRVGPVRITAGGLASPAAVRRAAFISFFIASVAGLILSAMSAWWLIAVGVLSIAAAWGYTGGKNPYGYLGLGEVFVFIFFGLVATVGTYYVQAEKITGQAILAGTIVGFLACAILVINNIRDRALDSEAGKKTLAVRIGDHNSRLLYSTLIVSPFILTIGFATPWTLLTLLALPRTISILRTLWTGALGRTLIPILAKTGELQILFCLALSLALILQRLV
jgi:1,4-dihydroxy-2-naphthoate polyprenyltransferase